MLIIQILINELNSWGGGVEVFGDKESPLQKANFVFSSLFASHLFVLLQR